MIIKKPYHSVGSGLDVLPNLVDYETTRKAFSWDVARDEFTGLANGRLNIAHEAVDRHALGAYRDHVAIRWIDRSGQTQDFSYAYLHKLTNRFANVLKNLEIGKGERVFVLAPRIPELYVTALGSLKNCSVFCPLFSAFGPEPIHARLAIGEAKVLRDEDGYFWYVGRIDYVINSSGHLISPYEVESVLMEHPAVAEAGAIGKPDPIAMEVVKAFVALKPGYTTSETLRREILAHARKRLGSVVAPREIEFLDDLPKTRSGKIMRHLLKARESGLPEGDTSMLENAT